MIDVEKCRWHLHIAYREWVVWGYGRSLEDSIGHVSQAYYEGQSPLPWSIPFTLPEHNPKSGLRPPQEIRRVKSWGWRFRTNDGINDTNWHLAESRSQCLTDAKVFLERSERPNSSLNCAIKDVREYLSGLW